AQAAALAAAEADVDGADLGAANDNNDHDNENERNGSTTPTGEPQGREVLSELTNILNTNKEEENGAVFGEQVEEADMEEKSEHEEANGKADKAAEDEHQANATSIISSDNNDKPNHISIHQDDTLQPPQKDLDAGSPTTELPLLNITPQRTPAKNIIKNEFAHMRSTSNKENMVPAEGAVTGPVDRMQTQVEFLGPGQETSHQGERAQPVQQPEDHDRGENGDAMQTEPKTPQAEDGQDDSLINHFEALSVSPKKQKFSEREVVPGAEQPHLPSQSTDAQKEPVKQTDKAKDDSQQSQKQDSNQGREKKDLASSTAKKPSSASATTDTTKPARKPSVRQSTLGRQSSVIRKSMAPPSRPEPSTSTAIKRTTSTKRSSVRPSMAPRAGSSQSTERPAAPAHIPHSKPRPMSMSFPTPPPPPKSSKAPTQSTFQLPGEAIAAKLKADKKARLQRQAESGASSQRQSYKPPNQQRHPQKQPSSYLAKPSQQNSSKKKKNDRNVQRKKMLTRPLTFLPRLKRAQNQSPKPHSSCLVMSLQQK
ncbi:unnamed protein product, partial [Aureobasidium vineae]